MITNNIVDLIGNTPLIKLKYPSEITTHLLDGTKFWNEGFCRSVSERALISLEPIEESVDQFGIRPQRINLA